ncbi:helix-turn-helix transcriptional regulator [Bradymonas sediminis]|uniref:Uncharacterized protein n=1 Tax=Bradymonas sediminis TaxID=1548548 RepID=A0A2Z4FPR5_9DELT|nr:helix-turn-helix transcriptional regulator [Bradymonas sediminis]AWV90890.1 hypothetical protein DN745_16795 [Bradymonas sediminis]TDP75374.1 regulatory LuxR family protein [Bradymonas sediminis]
MDQIDPKTWLALMRLCGELHEIGVAQVDAAIEHLQFELGKILDCEHFWLIAAGREPDGAPVPVFRESSGVDSARRDAIAADWMASTPNIFEDVLLKNVTRYMGKPGALCQTPERFDPLVWRKSVLRDLFCETGITSRLTANQPVGESFDLTFGFDRIGRSEPFSVRDCQVLRVMLEHLGPLARSFGQQRGFLPGLKVLSPRERSVLRYLLGPLSEKEIAHELNLSTGWLHQVVVSIYRKLNVRSRPELMSIWLSHQP